MTAVQARARDAHQGGRGSLLAAVSDLPWGLVALITGIALAGTAMLYSSTLTNPEVADLPAKHLVRFSAGFVLMIVLALVPLRLWMLAAFPAYAAALALLVGVELFGTTGGGAKRWLPVGPVEVQPSEFMKVAIIAALAAYYHGWVLKRTGAGEQPAPGLIAHLPPLALILVPAALVFRQPDFGTTLALIASGGVIIFLAGLWWRVIAAAGVAGVLAIVPVYYAVLAPYQRERVDTFLAQLLGGSVDVTGEGYQIEQAKIAVGSGGVTGKGFMQGIQAQLDYIPEQHTDFILTVIAEELGFIGATALLLVWAVVLGWGLFIARSAASTFGRLAASGAVAILAFYIVFNVSMVLGLVPVVGMPMPLVSYGGTAMVTAMACFGLILSVHLNRDSTLA